MRIVICLLACHLATPLLAEEVFRTLPGQPCTVDPHPEWSKAEVWAWAEICAGRIADMSKAPGGEPEKGCTPWVKEGDAEEWPDTRNLSADFIKTIATRAPYAAAPVRRAVRVRCAQVSGFLDLSDERLPQTLWLDDSRLPDGLSLYDTRVDGDLTFDGSEIGGSNVDANGLKVSDDLFFRRARLPRVNAVGAKIGGDLGAIGSSFAGLFNAGGLKVGGDLFLRGGASFGDGVIFRGAKIGGDLSAIGSSFAGLFNADRLEVGGGLYLRGGASFGDGVRLLGAKVGGDLSAIGSSFAGLFNADRLEVGGGLYLRGGASFGDGVRLLSAKVGGDLDAIGSSFAGLFNADGLEVGGGLYLRGGASFGDGVRLVGAKVGGGLDAIGSSFAGLFSADRLDVGGSLFLSDGASFGDGVDLLGAKVGGNLSATGSSFAGLFNADGLEVEGSIFLRDYASFDDKIDLTGARIGGDLQMQGSVFGGPVELDGAEIGDELLLSRGGLHAQWEEDASLILQNATIGSLQAVMPVPGSQNAVHSWQLTTADGGIAPLPVNLSNFTYTRLGGYGAELDHDLTRIDPARLIAWIEQSVPPGRNGQDGYAPQPYMQLAATLRDMGAEQAADAVDHARFMHRMETRDSIWLHTVDWLSNAFTGFGVYPERALIWFALLVGLGVLVSTRSQGFAGAGLFRRLFYSLENALPLIDLSGGFQDIDHGNAVVTNFFHFQKIAGFLLATVLVGALTLLGG